MNTTIPGIKAVHAIITPVCRANRTDEGAFTEAMRRLETEYLACLDHPSPGMTFHVVLTVERDLFDVVPAAAPQETP